MHFSRSGARSIRPWFLLVVGSVAISSCRDPVIPEEAFPPRAVPMDPVPDIYPEWWAQVEECSGIRRSYKDARFYEVPLANGWWTASGYIEGAWLQSGNRITVGEYRKLRSRLVRHEMLHAILQRGDHPDAYFVTKCGPIVSPSHDANEPPGQ